MPEPATITDIPEDLATALGLDLEYRVSALVGEKKLPADTPHRLSVVGKQAIDVATGVNARRSVLGEVIAYAESGTPLGEYAGGLLLGKTPAVMLNFVGDDSAWFNKVTDRSDGPYYLKEDMIDAVQQRRHREGKSFSGRWDDHTGYWTERGVSSGIAHGVWKALLQRARPEWMKDEGLDDFWQPVISKTPRGRTQYKIELETEHTLMRKRLVSIAAFSGAIMLEMYEEATTVGVKGIGPVGRQDIRMLLSEQYPELHPDS